MTIILDEIRSGYNLAKINYNFEIIEEYINNGSIDIENPELLGPLNMYGYRIYNLGQPVLPNDAVRLRDLNALIGEDNTPLRQTFRYVATAGQSVFTLPVEYKMGVGHLSVHIDGVRIRDGYEFDEVSPTSFELRFQAQAGAVVDVEVGVLLYTSIDASSIPYTDPVDQNTTVEAALDLLYSRDADDIPFDSDGNGSNDTTVGEYLRQDSIGVPSGVIVMWSGSVLSIPTGWFLCDGTNGTPNLTDRFIVGSGTKFTHASTGGSFDLAGTNTGYHTLTEGQLPSGATANVQAYSRGSGPDQSIPDGKDFSAFGATRYHENAGHTSSTANVWQRDGVFEATINGNDEGHRHTIPTMVDAIIPQYYALAFIMKG